MNLEQKHEMVTAISVEVFPGVLQTEQKHIGKWREAIDAEMNIRHSETCRRPSGARYLVGSTIAPMCKSRYPVHFVAVDVKSTRMIVDQSFSVPKCVRLTRMSEKLYELLCKMFSAVPERTKEELELILGRKFMGYVSGNFSSWDTWAGTWVRQKQRDSGELLSMGLPDSSRPITWLWELWWRYDGWKLMWKRSLDTRHQRGNNCRIWIV